MRQLILIVVLAGILTGCSNGPTNPLGMTDRARLRTDASVSIAQADERARVAEAQAQEAADIAVANAQIITEQSRQNGQTARVIAWSGMIPVALLIAGTTLVIALVVNWQGRIWYQRTIQAGPILTSHQVHTLTTDQVQLLKDYAAQTGRQLRVINGEYYLSDGKQTVKALLRG